MKRKAAAPILAAFLAACLVLPPPNLTFAGTRQWVQTDQDDFAAGTASNVDITGPGDIKLTAKGEYLYAFAGDGSPGFWRYDKNSDMWDSLTDAPGGVEAGGALIYDGGNYLYALRGNLQRNLWRYDIAADVWNTLTDTPGNVQEGGTIAHDGGNHIYALQGNDGQGFWRYDIAADNWTALTGTPAGVGGGGSLVYRASDNCVYALQGSYREGFWKYDAAGDKWSSLADTPMKVKHGGALVHDGGDYLYAIQGNDHNSLWRYDIPSDNWSTMTAAPGQVNQGGALAYDGENLVYALQCNERKGFWRYDIDIGSRLSTCWEPMTGAPGTIGDGGALIHGNNRYIYIMRGNNQKDFWRYDIDSDNWTAMASTPASVKEGGSMAYDGENIIYALRGNNRKSLWKYAIAADFWLSLADAPASVRAGGALVYDGDSYLYAFRGDDHKTFWRYDIANDNWTALADAPEDVKEGADLVFDGNRYVYALRGDSQKDFWRYDTLSDYWTSLTETPQKVGSGGALYYHINKYIYAFQGGSEPGFWKYDIRADSWAVLPDTPQGVGAGGSLAYDGNSYVYALRGNNQKTLWRYDTSYDSLRELAWVSLAKTPDNVDAGGSLAYQGPFYHDNGVFTSAVHDTARADNVWGDITWSETLNGQTIEVKVRTSQSRDMQGATDWDSCPAVPEGSDLSEVASVQDGDSYIQYRVELSTSVISRTPVLHDISIDFAARQPPGEAPRVIEVGLYDGDRAEPTGSMDPQSEYAIKASIADASAIADLERVKVTLYYDADGEYDPGEVPASGEGDSYQVLTFAAGSADTWGIQPAESGTGWTLLTDNCRPDPSAEWGDFWFHFAPSKLARETSGTAKWHINIEVDDGEAVAIGYLGGIDMNWYGEISVGENIIPWESVAGSAEPGRLSGVFATYTSNGPYLEQAAAAGEWQGASHTAALDEDGKLEAGELRITAKSLSAAGESRDIALAASPDYTTIASDDATTETGPVTSERTLWFELGPEVTEEGYTGTVYYCIAR